VPAGSGPADSGARARAAAPKRVTSLCFCTPNASAWVAGVGCSATGRIGAGTGAGGGTIACTTMSKGANTWSLAVSAACSPAGASTLSPCETGSVPCAVCTAEVAGRVSTPAFGAASSGCPARSLPISLSVARTGRSLPASRGRSARAAGGPAGRKGDVSSRAASNEKLSSAGRSGRLAGRGRWAGAGAMDGDEGLETGMRSISEWVRYPGRKGWASSARCAKSLVKRLSSPPGSRALPGQPGKLRPAPGRFFPAGCLQGWRRLAEGGPSRYSFAS
jgi:hypothetical protein